MNGPVRSDMLRPAMPQNSMLAMGSNQFLSSNQPGQPQIPMPPHSGPNPQIGMLGAGPQNPNPQRYPVPMAQGNPMHPQQRPMIMRPGPGSDGQPMNPAMPGLPHNSQLQGMNFNNMAQAGNPMVRRTVPGPMNPTHMPGLPQGPMGMNPQTSMPAQIRAVQSQSQQMRMGGAQIPEMGMGRGNPLPERQGPMPPMNSLSTPPSIGQPHQMLGGMGGPQANFANIPQPPQLSSSPRPGPGPGPHPQTIQNMGMNGPGPGQQLKMQGDDFMYTNAQFQPGPSTSRNGSLPFPSSTPPIGEMGAGMANNPTANNRSSFQLTPAEQFKAMQQHRNDFNPVPPQFGIPNPNVPPRPPSHNPPPAIPPQPPQQPQHAPSPHSYPQRPSSRPSSQSGPPHPSQTPRPNQQPVQPQIPPGGPQVGRGPPSSQPQPVPQPPGAGVPIAPRPPAAGSSPGASTAQSSEQPQQQPSGPVTIPRPPVNVFTLALGSGQGLTRLLQFSGNLSNESSTKYQLSWWNDLIKEYFTPKAVMKLTLWKDNQRHEAKPFEIGVPILPRFFLVTTQSGVKSMTLSLDGARERMYAPGHAVVECVTAVWTYRYKNGYIVTLRGPLAAHVIITSPHPHGNTQATQPGNFILKFDDFQFDANFHDKYIALDAIQGQRTPAPDPALSPRTPRLRNTPPPNGSAISDDDKLWEEPRLVISNGSIPGEPVNAFGIPQATMRCLELAESVAQMTDLITFANETTMGPLDALAKFAHKIRDSQGLQPGAPLLNGMHNGHPSLPFAPPFSNPSSVASTLYSSAPPSVTNPSSAPTTSTMSSPQNAPNSAQNSPQKQHKAIPPPAPSAGAGSSSAPAPSTPVSTNNTPALSNASLKRKQTVDSSSPTTASAENPPPAKRITRNKRGRTGGG